MHLAADVLDKLLHDAHGHPAGRVDGVLLSVRAHKPPRVAYLEISPITLLARVHRGLARWYAKIDARIRGDRGKPFRIPWRDAQVHKRYLTVELVEEDTPIVAVEQLVRSKVLE